MITDYLKYLNDNAYIVKKEVTTHNFQVKGRNELNMKLVEDYMKWLGCDHVISCLLYTSPSPRDRQKSRMPSSA